MSLLLYDYFRSTACYRLRIALALKGLAHESTTVHLLRDGGEHLKPDYRAINPQARVPSLRLESGEVLTQSPAIIEYLEEVHPEPPFLPRDRLARAKVRAVAAIIGCDIHPLNNSSPLGLLRQKHSFSEADIEAWVTRWIGDGLEAVEALIGDSGWCFGETPGLADIYLVPVSSSARRFHVPLERFPRISRVLALAADHPAFRDTAPEKLAEAAG